MLTYRDDNKKAAEEAKMKARIQVDDDGNEEIKKLQNQRGNQESSLKIMMNQ